MKNKITLLFTGILLCANTLEVSAQVTHRRVIDALQEHYDGAIFQKSDSTHINYSGTHEGNVDIDPPVLDYDNGMNYTWNTGTSSWTPTYRATSTFDANDDIVKQVSENWNGSSWDVSTQTIMTYDAAHNRLSSVTQNWNTGTSSWVNSYRTMYTYTGNQLTTSIDQNWNSGASTWDNSGKYSYTYNLAGKKAEMVRQNWSGGAWVNDTKETYSYNSGNQLTTTLALLWNSGTSTWNNYRRTINTYDANNDPVTMTQENWNGSSYENYQKTTIVFNQHQRTMFENQYWNSGGFWEYTTSSYRATYYYQSFITSGITNVPLEAKIDVYPVPATDKLNITIANSNGKTYSLMLTDMSGHKVKLQESPAYNNVLSLPVADLPTGNYILSIQTGNSSAVKQVAIVH